MTEAKQQPQVDHLTHRNCYELGDSGEHGRAAYIQARQRQPMRLTLLRNGWNPWPEMVPAKNL